MAQGLAEDAQAAAEAAQAAVEGVLAAIYPVGSVYINATNSTNPATLLGFGTWVAFGAGRVMAGYDSGNANFNAAEKTGGEETHVLTVDEMPIHSHDGVCVAPGAPGTDTDGDGNGAPFTRAGGTSTAGGGAAHNILQSYITVFAWKRTV